MDKEIAIAKNQWLIDNNIIYELEKSPITPHLFLIQIISIFLGVAGIALLIIFFGNSITEEKERYTWLTIKTQPISEFKLIASKYLTYIMMTAVFIMLVIGISILIPFIYSGKGFILAYPQVLIKGEQFTIISTGEYLLRNVLLFFCVSTIVFGFCVLVSKWVNKSTNLYYTVGLLLGMGYYSTSNIIKSPFNPFFLLNFKDILVDFSSYSHWSILLSTLIWSTVLLLLAVYISEPELKGGVYVNDNRPFANGKINMGNGILFKMVNFEWRKVRREGLAKSLVITILITSLSGYYILTQLTEQKENEYLKELDFRINASIQRSFEYQDTVNHLKGENLEIHGELLVYYQNLIDFEEKYQEKVENAILGYHNGDWVPFHEYQLFVNKLAFERTYSPNNTVWVPETLGRFTKLASIIEKELLIERNIRPIFPGEFIPTIHQSWTTMWGDTNTRTGWGGVEVDREEWERQNTKIDNSGLFSLILFFKNYIYLLPTFLILFFTGGMAKEKGKKNTISLLKTQPISEKKVFLAKVINSSLMSLGITLLVSLIIIAIGTILNRFGDWNYPILHYNSFRTMISSGYTGFKGSQGGFHFITLGEYLLKSIILLGVMNLFVVNLAILVSIFFKKTLAVFSCTTILLLAGYWLNWRKILEVSPYSPFTYFNLPQIINGELATIQNNPIFNVQKGLWVLNLLTCLLIGAGYLIVIQKKLFKRVFGF